MCSAGHQNNVFLSVLYQQMVAEIESKSFNQIGQGNFAAMVAEIQLIELWIDEHGKSSGVKYPRNCFDTTEIVR